MKKDRTVAETNWQELEGFSRWIYPDSIISRKERVFQLKSRSPKRIPLYTQADY